MKIAVIINPTSGGGRIKQELPAIRKALEKRFGALEYLTTQSHGHARDLARRLADDGTDLIVAVGGDGTISECADGIVSSDHPQTAMAFIPAGTGSDFARNFGAFGSLDEWVARITYPRISAVDTSAVTFDTGDKAFNLLNIASFGITGPIAARVNSKKQGGWLPGKIGFFIYSVLEMLRFKPVRVRLAIDERPPFEVDIMLVAIANGPIFGGGMIIAPHAVLDDGYLDIVIIASMPLRQHLFEFTKVYRGRHIHNKNVTIIRAKTIHASVVDGTKGDNGTIEIDGETLGSLPARFTLTGKSINLAMEISNRH